MTLNHQAPLQFNIRVIRVFDLLVDSKSNRAFSGFSRSKSIRFPMVPTFFFFRTENKSPGFSGNPATKTPAVLRVPVH